MFDRERTLFRFVLTYCHKLAADVEDEKFAYQPYPGANPPAWIVGHLAVVTDYILMFLGQPRQCPEDWAKKFGPGSTPSGNLADYPPRAELMAALERGHQKVDEAIQKVAPQMLGAPNPFEPMREFAPTLGEMLSHMMTTHPAFHMGQFSTWRRIQGKPGVLF